MMEEEAEGVVTKEMMVGMEVGEGGSTNKEG